VATKHNPKEDKKLLIQLGTQNITTNKTVSLNLTGTPQTNQISIFYSMNMQKIPEEKSSCDLLRLQNGQNQTMMFSINHLLSGKAEIQLGIGSNGSVKTFKSIVGQEFVFEDGFYEVIVQVFGEFGYGNGNSTGENPQMVNFWLGHYIFPFVLYNVS
jgi:hypothetical protein